MDSLEKLDVDDWRDIGRPIAARTDEKRRFLPPTLIGVLGTVLLHAMLIQSLPFVGHRPKHKIVQIQQSTAALPESTTDPDSLVLIASLTKAEASETVGAHNLVDSVSNLKSIKIKSPIDTESPRLEILALSDDMAASNSAGLTSDAERVRLLGIYTGQIQARIERIWRKPRTPVSDISEGTSSMQDSFQCEAQIIQDSAGIVQEILLPRCNGSSEWQRSLILAIQQASPLPAPPSEKVFTRSIVLQFLGLAYVAGNLEDEYEFAPRDARAN